MSRETSELRHAIRFTVVRKYLGQLLLIMAVLTVVPLGFSLVVGEYHLTLWYTPGYKCAGIHGVSSQPQSRTLGVQANEALVLAVAIFFLAPAAMAFVFMGSRLNFMDALFEAIFAATTKSIPLFIACSISLLRKYLLTTSLPPAHSFQ